MMFTVTSAIFAEAVLSFLGLLDLRMSWGIMIHTANAGGYLLGGTKYWWLVVPAAALDHPSCAALSTWPAGHSTKWSIRDSGVAITDSNRLELFRVDSDAVLKVSDLSLSYQTRQGEVKEAVQDVSFELLPGESLALLESRVAESLLSPIAF